MTGGTRRILAALVALLPAASAAPAGAGIVWDYSPATTGASITPSVGALESLAFDQNFAERISFPNPVLLTGMDIYTRDGMAHVGQSATIRIRTDSSGIPGGLLEDFAEAISIVDTQGAVGANVVRAHVDFTHPVALTGMTAFWIGMSGTFTPDLGQLGLSGAHAPGDARMYQFVETVPDHFVNDGDMAFRLFGEEQAAAVPEPASLTIWGLGALGAASVAVCGTTRRRRQTWLA
jgi:hypothetical protein